MTLPDLAEDFPSDVQLTGFLIGQNSLGCRNDGHAETVQYLWYLLTFDINPSARFAYPLNTGDGAFLGVGELKINSQDSFLIRIPLHIESADIAGLLQYLGDIEIDLRKQNINTLHVYPVCVSDSCQHIRNWIGHPHFLSLLKTSTNWPL